MYLVFDIGGTNTRIAQSSDGQTLESIKTFPTEKNFEQEIRLISQTVKEIAGISKIESASGGIAGTLDKEGSLLLSAPHLREWVQKPLKEELEFNLDAPVFLENDTALAGLGEANLGAGKGKSIVAYITVSTGVGGVRIVDKKIDKNAFGFEVGHQIILPEGASCDCGGKGHWETLIAGSYLERTHKVKPEQIKDATVWDEVIKYLSIGLHNIIVSWSPEIIILGGSVIKSIPLEKVKVKVSEYLTIFPQGPDIVLAELGDEAGLYGALQLIRVNTGK